MGHRLTDATAPDGRFISWKEHLIDDEASAGPELRGSDGLVMADLNLDGHMDIVSVHESDTEYDGQADGLIRIAFGSGDPDRWTSVTVASGAEAGAPEDVAVGDVNGDGYPDIVAACELAHLLYLQNPGAAAATAPWPRLIPEVASDRGSYIRAFLADLDGDGRLDVVAPNKGAQNPNVEMEPKAISWFSIEGDPLDHASWIEHELTRVRWPINARPVDLDSDGDLDIVGGSVAEARIFWFENRGDGDFAEHDIPVSGTAVPEERRARRDRNRDRAIVTGFNMDFDDLSGDGRLDIVLAEAFHTLVWLEQPSESSAEWTLHEIGSHWPDQLVGLRLADINGDGRNDVITGGYSRSARDRDAAVEATTPMGRLAWFEQPAAARERWIRHDLSRRQRGMFDAFVARDMDEDGDIDFVSTRGNSAPYDGVFWLEQRRTDAPIAAFERARSEDSPERALPPTQALLDAYTPVTEAMLVEPPDDEWLMWRRSYDHWGYSPLSQINVDNVSALRLAWAWTMERGRQETTPLVHDGVMFLPQPCDFVEAVDARDGTPLWEYRRARVQNIATYACVTRNAALHGDRLFLATHDAHLVALNARTGAVEWDVPVGDWTVGHHYSGGPQVIDGLVVAGISGCYYINSACWISAHDVETGQEVWRTHTIPRVGEPGDDTWGGIPEEQRLGGSAWIAPSYDAELGLIFSGVAVPVPWGSVQRGTGDGDVLYTNSTLALDAKTGQIRWYFQHLPGDEWDMDHPYERIVVESEVAPDPLSVEWINPSLVAGERRKVITGLPGKPGLVWTLDAATGDFLWARSTGFQNVIVGVDVENRKGIPNPSLQSPELGQETLVCPHLTGGRNWQATAYSPQTNALYAQVNNTCMEYTLNPVDPELGRYHRSARYTRVHAPDSDGHVGQLVAVDVATGETLWEHRQRAGIGGSILTTAGGLVFVTDDARRFRAFDAETGAVLWEQVLNSSAGGFPVSYAVDGVQFVAIAAGGGPNYRNLTPEIRQRTGGNTLFVFRLP